MVKDIQTQGNFFCKDLVNLIEFKERIRQKSILGEEDEFLGLDVKDIQ